MILWAILLASLASAPCHARGRLPDATCSPGLAETTDLAIICHTSTRARRHVSEALKRQVLAEYGVRWSDRAAYVIDHVIPIEIGGDGAAVENLWPQPVVDSKAKDFVEDVLHRRVCSGAMSAAQAQRRIARSWPEALDP